MRVESAPTKTNKGSGPHPLDRRWRGHWLWLARSGWLGLVILTLAIFFASLPVYIAQLNRPCAGSACWYTQLSPQQVEALKGMGLSLDHYVAYTVALTVVSVMVSLVLSALLVWRKAGDPMALLVALMLVTFGPLGATASVVAISSPWQLPNECLYFLALSLLVLVFLLFPGGQFVPSGTRWIFVVCVLGLVPTAFVAPSVPNSLIDVLTYFMSLGALATLALIQVYRYQRVSNPTQRQQTKWVVFGMAVFITIVIGGSLLKLLFPLLASPASLYPLALNLIFYLLPPLLPLSFGFAILRYRLWEIDLLINRTLVYGLLSASVVGIYVVGVSIPGTLFNTSGNFFISLLATGFVAVLFQPLRVRLQQLINRLMYGERHDPYVVLSRLLSRLEATLAPEAVLSTIVESVAQALKLPYVAITLKQGDTFTPAATFGIPHNQLKPFSLPLIYQTETIGQLLLAPRAPGEAFNAADQTLLENLARQAGVAVHAVRLTADLQRSREQLVATREEERRRLRRDLHDGLGPSLASLTFKVDAARNLLGRDSARAEVLLAEVREQAQQAISDIRRLVYNLRPPALDELGLLSALREQGVPYQHQGLRVAFDLPEVLPALPAAVEVAAYRIAQEALTNVVRHAQAQHCLLQLGIKSNTLYLDISDDGRGIGVNHKIGIGLHTMQERASELGGSCVVARGPSGGTLIQIRLPLPREPESLPFANSNESKVGQVEE